MRKAREALETVISLINSTEKWNARVVYGDTDRLVHHANFIIELLRNSDFLLSLCETVETILCSSFVNSKVSYFLVIFNVG